MSRAPQLNRRLALEAPERRPDGAGGFATDWSTLGHLWAAVVPVPPALRDAPGATEVAQPVRVTVRAAPPGAPSRPVAGQRLRDGDRLLAIEAVLETDPAGRFLTCIAREETHL